MEKQHGKETEIEELSFPSLESWEPGSDSIHFNNIGSKWEKEAFWASEGVLPATPTCWL